MLVYLSWHAASRRVAGIGNGPGWHRGPVTVCARTFSRFRYDCESFGRATPFRTTIRRRGSFYERRSLSRSFIDWPGKNLQLADSGSFRVTWRNTSTFSLRRSRVALTIRGIQNCGQRRRWAGAGDWQSAPNSGILRASAARGVFSCKRATTMTLDWRRLLRDGLYSQSRLSRRAHLRRRRPLAPAELLEDRALLSVGDLDPTFGNGGKVVTDIPGPAQPGTDDSGRDIVAYQSDGKSIMVGESSGEIVVVRYETDGTLDASFGINGIMRFKL